MMSDRFALGIRIHCPGSRANLDNLLQCGSLMDFVQSINHFIRSLIIMYLQHLKL